MDQVVFPSLFRGPFPGENEESFLRPAGRRRFVVTLEAREPM